MRLSICVCTYNRAHILPYCLESLANLKVPAGCEAEILVIDNNSVDNTKDVVDYYIRRCPVAIFYFHESQQGIASARNRALKEARGDYVGFLDDECAMRPDWLQIIVGDIDEFAPFIIGGPYIGGLFPGTAPKWFKAEYGNAYFLASNLERGFQKEFRASSGNMFLHRRVCRTQQFGVNLGKKANKLKLGEEIVLQERFLSENPGAAIFYEPRIEVTHYILPQKMSLAYRARRVMESGAFRYSMGSAFRWSDVARAVADLCASPLGAICRDRTTYPYWQNYAYERVIPRVMPRIGAVLEKFRGRYR